MRLHPLTRGRRPMVSKVSDGVSGRSKACQLWAAFLTERTSCTIASRELAARALTACRRCRRTPEPPAASARDLVGSLPVPAPARSPGPSAHAQPSVCAADCLAERLCLQRHVSAVRHRLLATARGRCALYARTMAGANALDLSMLIRSSLPLAVCSLFGHRSFFLCLADRSLSRL